MASDSAKTSESTKNINGCNNLKSLSIHNVQSRYLIVLGFTVKYNILLKYLLFLVNECEE